MSSNYINRILLAKGPNGSNLDQLFEVKNRTGASKHSVILNDDYDLSANMYGGDFYLTVTLSDFKANGQKCRVIVPRSCSLKTLYTTLSAGITSNATININKLEPGGAAPSLIETISIAAASSGENKGHTNSITAAGRSIPVATVIELERDGDAGGTGAAASFTLVFETP